MQLSLSHSITNYDKVLLLVQASINSKAITGQRRITVSHGGNVKSEEKDTESN